MWSFLKPISYLLGFKNESPKKDHLGWQLDWTNFIKNTYYSEPELEAIFSQADDIKTLRPDWFDLTVMQRCEVLAAFWKAIALYESDYNPRSQSVDVGIKSNKDTWSIGLMQMSVIDQSNHGIRLGYDFDDLLEPCNNINLAIRVMSKQLVRRHRIFIPKGSPGVYWATICPGGKYDKSKFIIKAVQGVSFDKTAK